MRAFRNLVLLALALGASCPLASLLVGIPLFMLPIAAMEARDDPRAGHEFGLWLLLWLSLPFWLVATWTTVLTIVFEGTGWGRRLRRGLWACAVVLTVLALLALGTTPPSLQAT